MVRMEKLDPPLTRTFTIEDLFSPQQGAAHLYVLAHRTERNRWQPHGVATSEAGADTQDCPARGKQVDGCNRVSRDRGNAVAGNGHASGELDLFRMLSRQGHARIHVAVDHLRVIEPGVSEAMVLSDHQIFPGVWPSWIGNAKFHTLLLCCFKT